MGIPVKGLGWLTGYLAMVVGAIMTILVQSSSVFTSTLTPLAGAGLVSLERAYPLTLGANLGTTTTSILASFAAGGENIQAALQISLVHLFFNLSGILLFYPVPCMRWPISIARVLGNTTSQYRWFAVLYLCFMFFIFPLSMFGLSMAGPNPIYLVIILLLIVIIFAVTVSNLQISHPTLLPTLLQNWNFLPLWLHSLDPWDELVMTAIGCCCRKKGWDDEQLKEVIINRETSEDRRSPADTCCSLEKEIKNESEDSTTLIQSKEVLSDDSPMQVLLVRAGETEPSEPASIDRLLDNCQQDC